MNRIINTLALATADWFSSADAPPILRRMKPLREGTTENRPCLFRRRTTGNPCDDRNRRRPFQRAWEVDIDKLGIHATLNGVAQINKPFVFSSEGIFKGELTPGTGAWTYLAYYPHGEQSLNGTSATIPFGNTRIQKAEPTTACSTF